MNGGYLVEIESQEEQDALLAWIWEEVERVEGVEVLPPYQNPLFWIGLTDVFHDGTWVWDNLGKPLDYSNWAPREPNNWGGVQHCAAIKLWGENGKWDDVGCEAVKIEHMRTGETYGHICEAAGDIKLNSQHETNSHRIRHDLHKGDWEEVGEREREDFPHEGLDGP